jgi:hypothetical protein
MTQCGGGVVVVAVEVWWLGFITDNNTTPTKRWFKLFWVVGWFVAMTCPNYYIFAIT